MKILTELTDYIKSTIEFKKNQYKLWKNEKLLQRLIKLADAKSKGNGKQYHVFKVGNGYAIKSRLDFKLNRNLTTKEKENLNIFKLRQSAIYSTPLCSDEEARFKKEFQKNENKLRKKDEEQYRVSLPQALLVYTYFKPGLEYETFENGKWEKRIFMKQRDEFVEEQKNSYIHRIRLGNVRLKQKEK